MYSLNGSPTEKAIVVAGYPYPATQSKLQICCSYLLDFFLDKSAYINRFEFFGENVHKNLVKGFSSDDL